MKRTVGYLFIGIFFGIVMYKSEAASWFRIYEMFRFDSFHMYGIIGSALLIGVIGVQLIKRKNLKSFYGEPIKIASKEKGFKKYLFGGIIFGLRLGFGRGMSRAYLYFNRRGICIYHHCTFGSSVGRISVWIASEDIASLSEVIQSMRSAMDRKFIDHSFSPFFPVEFLTL